MKKQAVYIGTIIGFSIISIAVLYSFSETVKHSENGFTRVFPPHAYSSAKALNLNFNSYYFAGTNGEDLLLANYTYPKHMISVDTSLIDTNHVELKFLLGERKVAWKALTVIVYPNNIYAIESISPNIFSGSITTKRLVPRNLHEFRFLKATVSPQNQLYATIFNKNLKESYIVKPHLYGSINDTLSYNLEKQVDGLFCVDGELLFNESSDKILYVYYYRNQYIILDTNLNLQTIGRTVDTNSTAKIDVQYVENTNGEVAIVTPANTINNKTCTFGDRIYINSFVKANNEDADIFNKYSVIDVYSINRNEYEFSFYVPKINKHGITDMKVLGRTLFVIIDNTLLKYPLNY